MSKNVDWCYFFVSHTETHSSKESAGIPYPFTEDEREAIKSAFTSLNDGLLKDKMHLEIMDMDTVTGPAATHAKYLIRKIQDCKFYLGIVEFDGISKWSQKEYAKALRLKKWGKLREIFMFVRRDNGRRSEVNDKRFFNGSSSDNPWINEYESPAELKSGIITAFERHYNEYEKYQKRRDRIIRIVLAAIAFLLGFSLLCVIFREPINKWIHPDNTQQIDSTFVIESKGDNSNEVVSRKEVEGENSGSHDSPSSRPPITDGNKGRASGKQEDKVSTSESSGTSESSKSTEPETVEITPSESFEEEVTVSGTVIADETISEVPKLSIGDNIEVVPGLKETIVLLSSNGNSGYVMYHEGRHASEFLSNLDIALYYDGCVYPTIEELMEIYKHRAVIGVWSGIIRSGTPAGRNEHFALDFATGEKIAVKDNRTDVYNLLIRHFAK